MASRSVPASGRVIPVDNPAFGRSIGKIPFGQPLAIAQQHGAFHGVPQLAHVAGPRMTPRRFDCLRSDILDLVAELAVEAVDRTNTGRSRRPPTPAGPRLCCFAPPAPGARRYHRDGCRGARVRRYRRTAPAFAVPIPLRPCRIPRSSGARRETSGSTARRRRSESSPWSWPRLGYPRRSDHGFAAVPRRRMRDPILPSPATPVAASRGRAAARTRWHRVGVAASMRHCRCRSAPGLLPSWAGDAPRMAPHRGHAADVGTAHRRRR